MKSFEEQFARFTRDVEKHTVHVLRDDGLYRHLWCSDGSYCMSFNVVTWPGYLCYAGDMGCFVFTRIADMFEFFRGQRTATIDRIYIAQKAVAVDKPDGIERFSDERFREVVKAEYDTYVEEWTDDDRKQQLWAEIEEEVLPSVDDGLGAAISAATGFTFEGRHVFTDLWDHHFEEFTGRFVWGCYAIPWAIEQYDAMKESKANEVNAVENETQEAPESTSPQGDGDSTPSESTPETPADEQKAE